MTAAKIAGRHLYRVRFSFVDGGFKFLLEGRLNITTADRGLGSAGRATMAVMRTAAFRDQFPGAIVRDMTYQGTIDT